MRTALAGVVVAASVASLSVAALLHQGPGGPVHIQSAGVLGSPSPGVLSTDTTTPQSPLADTSPSPGVPASTPPVQAAPSPVAPVAPLPPPVTYCGYTYQAGPFPLEPGPSTPVYSSCETAIAGGPSVGTVGGIGGHQVVGLIRSSQGNVYLLSNGDWLAAWKIVKS